MLVGFGQQVVSGRALVLDVRHKGHLPVVG